MDLSDFLLPTTIWYWKKFQAASLILAIVSLIHSILLTVPLNPNHTAKHPPRSFNQFLTRKGGFWAKNMRTENLQKEETESKQRTNDKEQTRKKVVLSNRFKSESTLSWQGSTSDRFRMSNKLLLWKQSNTFPPVGSYSTVVILDLLRVQLNFFIYLRQSHLLCYQRKLPKSLTRIQ